MYLAKVYVTYKPSILDPQGESIKGALQRLQFSQVMSVTQGKYFELRLSAETQNVAQVVTAICEQLLTNVNMETYRFDIEEVEMAACDSL